ncbi:MAG: signal recognition particle protein [Spirochaetales bacterium]|nr:signal recognition particle protein [Spirochaetales bacterium]MBO6048759.1 signal recognition particle protein [Spirochaetales bacterium]MBP5757292.1 signal recognition particle protein [Spirochaetales bacterium]
MFDSISDRFSSILRSISGKSKISEKNVQDAVEEIKIALLDADVNLRVVRRFVNRTMEEAKGDKVLKAVDPGQQFTKIVYDKMVQLLGDQDNQKLNLKGPDTVTVILMMGLQGSGKTTTSAKLATLLKKQGRRVMMAACDLIRPAAITQLQVLGEQVGVPVHADLNTKDAVKVAVEALKRAKREQYDVLIIDTSGRMYLDEAMMKELMDINAAVHPDETLFVADAMTGQNAVTIAQEFEQKVGISGVILTKFDSDTRGGAALSLREVVGKPIKFIGVGEKLDNLEPFYPDRMASRILGMGDIVTLVEKAQEAFDQKQAERLQEKMAKNTFDLQDYLEQIENMTKMGGLGKIIDMLPGAKGNISEEDINKQEMLKEKAIIQSMTFQERQNIYIIGPARKRRIAKGSGTSVGEVGHLLKKFEKMRLNMKKLAKNKKYQAAMMKQMGMN